jgi:hypothetical protein
MDFLTDGILRLIMMLQIFLLVHKTKKLSFTYMDGVLLKDKLLIDLM